MEYFKVLFLPDQKEVEVKERTSLPLGDLLSLFYDHSWKGSDRIW